MTEAHYKDRANDTGTGQGTACQFPVFGLKADTTYNFRVRCYAKNDAGTAVYGEYSEVDSAATSDTGWTLRYVDVAAGGVADGTSWTDAWTTMYAATQAVSDKTLVLVKGGTYHDDRLVFANAGSAPDSRIIVQGNPVSGETVTLTRDSTTPNPRAVDTNGKDYLVIDSIVITDATANASDFCFHLNGSDRCTFAGLSVTGPGMVGYNNPPHTTTANYNFFHNCFFGGWGTSDGQSGGWYSTGACTYNVHVNCKVGPIAHGINYGSGCTYNAVLNCLLGLDGGQCPELFGGSDYTLVEGNYYLDSAQGISDIGKPAIQVQSNYNVVRRTY